MLPSRAIKAKADFSVRTDPEGHADAILSLKGDWRIINLAGMKARLDQALGNKAYIHVESTELKALDTAGAYLIGTVLNGRLTAPPFTEQPDFERLYHRVAVVVEEVQAQAHHMDKRHLILLRPLWGLMISLGQATIHGFKDMESKIGFLGHVITALFSSLFNPRRIRWAALVSLMQRAGLESLPIVGTTNFFVGAVIAFLGVLQLRQFGVSIYAIDMLGMATLREFGPVIAAVLLAGRSASSFAAEIGTMKMNQEIDAMRVLGIDPYDALILPRIMSLVIMTPLVSFAGALSGLVGGALIIWMVLGYEPALFIQRMWDTVPFVHFFVGMVKTPFFAGAIGIIGCHAGLTVEDDVISLGRQVTKAVVQGIFAIFLLNALFALLFNGFEFP